MCKKLIYSCFILVIAVMAVPASAMEPILAVDVDGESGDTQAGFTSWAFARSLSQNCYTKTIGDYDLQLCFYGHDSGVLPGARNRGDLCSWNYGDVLQDFAFYGSTGNVLMGREYIELTIDWLDPDTKYEIGVWSYDSAYATAYAGGEDLKWSAWGTENPSDYLDSLGYGPGEGYHPTDWDDPCTPEDESGIYKNPIPTLNRINMQKDEATGLPQDGPYFHYSDFCVTTDEYGTLKVYGWFDGETMSGSQHVPINGFVLVPEPATIALLGLGGLALLRRRRR